MVMAVRLKLVGEMRCAGTVNEKKWESGEAKVAS